MALKNAWLARNASLMLCALMVCNAPVNHILALIRFKTSPSRKTKTPQISPNQWQNVAKRETCNRYLGHPHLLAQQQLIELPQQPTELPQQLTELRQPAEVQSIFQLLSVTLIPPDSIALCTASTTIVAVSIAASQMLEALSEVVSVVQSRS